MKRNELIMINDTARRSDQRIKNQQLLEAINYALIEVLDKYNLQLHSMTVQQIK